MYPSVVKQCNYGKCLLASRDVPAGTLVQKFEGHIIPNDSIPPGKHCHVIIWNQHSVMVPETDAQYANHSCNPNSYVNEKMEIITMRFIKEGEEITFSYNIVYDGEDPGQWDQRWSFRCMCGAPCCQGEINKYVTKNHEPWIPQQVKTNIVR